MTYSFGAMFSKPVLHSPVRGAKGETRLYRGRQNIISGGMEPKFQTLRCSSCKTIYISDTAPALLISSTQVLPPCPPASFFLRCLRLLPCPPRTLHSASIVNVYLSFDRVRDFLFLSSCCCKILLSVCIEHRYVSLGYFRSPLFHLLLLNPALCFHGERVLTLLALLASLSQLPLPTASTPN